MTKTIHLLTGALLVSALTLHTPVMGAPLPTISVVAVDPLLNVFRDDTLPTTGTAEADSARGEHATFQLVVTSSPVTLTRLKCETSRFAQTDGTQLPGTPRVRFVGYVGNSHTAKKPARDQLRAAPAMFPDPLHTSATLDIAEGHNQPIWIDIHVPKDATPGDYHSTATVTGKLFGKDTTATLPLKLTVYSATIDKTRLNVTLWYQLWHRAGFDMPERFSEEYWEMVRNYVRNMVAHRQNWARVETLWLTRFGSGPDGKLTFDFTHFDRWMEILISEGITNFEGLQFAWRGGKWEEPFHVEIHDADESNYRGRNVPIDSPEAEAFFSQFFPALHSHLSEKGWLENYVQHVGDEPVTKNAESYTSASNLLRKYAPGIPVMEACLDHNMVGAVDIWVPVLQNLHRDFKFFQERKKAGNRVWFYTCLHPEEEYANRFVELPLIKTRLLHWINYRYDIEGYLHWGYNFWRPHPWQDAADPGKLPGGDAWIVYPDPHSHGIVESIRYEAMRDGIEDHELLSQLGEKNPEAAMELAKRHIHDFNKYETNLQQFRNTRRELLKALSQP